MKTFPKARFALSSRSAGACPPRFLKQNANVRSSEATDVCCHDRRTARDRPSPYVSRRDLLCRFRSAGACPPRFLICLNQDIQDSQDFQDYEGFDSTCLFRSVRTCVSIENRASPFSRSARSLIKSPIGKHDVLYPPVARGPVPRDPSNKTQTSAARRPRTFAVTTGARRGTGPRPTV